MNFIDKQDVSGLEIGHQRGDITRLLKDGATRRFELHPHFFRDDAGECGFAQPGRPKDQRMVEGFTPLACGRQKNLHLLAHRALPDVFVEPAWSNRPIHRVVALIAGIGRNQSIGLNHTVAPCPDSLIADLRPRSSMPDESSLHYWRLAAHRR